MFKIEFYCDDKNLAAVLRAMAGKVMDLKTVPVSNAVAANGSVKAVVRGDAVAQLAHWLKQKKLTVVNAADLRQFQSDAGRSPAGYSHLLRASMDAGLLKRQRGSGGQKSKYEVHQPTSKQ